MEVLDSHVQAYDVSPHHRIVTCIRIVSIRVTLLYLSKEYFANKRAIITFEELLL